MPIPKGVIHQQIRAQLQQRCHGQFTAQLRQLGFKGKKLEDMTAGFLDGYRSGMSDACDLISSVYPEFIEADTAQQEAASGQ